MSIDGKLRILFRKYLREPDFVWTSIETGGTGKGIADSNYLAMDMFADRSVEGWVEYKFTRHYSVDLRPEQIGWALKRSRMRGRAWIAVRSTRSGGPRSSPADELWLIPGRLAIEAKSGGLLDPRVVDSSWHWEGSPSTWDWEQVAALLRA